MAVEKKGTYGESFGEEFQAHILAIAARLPGFVIRYRSALSHTYFVSEIHRSIAKVLFAEIDKFRVQPTEVTLMELVRKEVDDAKYAATKRVIESLYKADISDAPSVEAQAIEFGKVQAMCNAVVEAAEAIEENERPKVLPIIKKAEMVGTDLLDVGIDYHTVERDHLYKDTDEDQTDLIPTGVHLVDRMLHGGLGRGELGVVLGPPKRGKTTALINFGHGGALAGFNVVHYTCEMLPKRVTMRYDDRLAGPLVKLRSTDPLAYGKELTERATKFMRGGLIIKGYPTRTATVSMLRSHITLLQSRGFYPDLIVVDYADILRPERRLGEMRHEQAGIYEDLRSMAGEFDAACWTGSQAGKLALEKDTVTMADFAEAFEKGAIVDVALGFSQTDDERLEQKCRLFGAAIRNHEDGLTVECEIRRDRCLLRSIALYDGSMARIDTEDDKPKESTEEAPVVSTVQAAPGSNKALRDKLGMKVPMRKLDTGGKKWPKKKPVSPPKTPVKKDKRPMRISKRVGDNA